MIAQCSSISFVHHSHSIYCELNTCRDNLHSYGRAMGEIQDRHRVLSVHVHSKFRALAVHLAFALRRRIRRTNYVTGQPSVSAHTHARVPRKSCL